MSNQFLSKNCNILNNVHVSMTVKQKFQHACEIFMHLPAQSVLQAQDLFLSVKKDKRKINISQIQVLLRGGADYGLRILKYALLLFLNFFFGLFLLTGQRLTSICKEYPAKN